MLRFPKEPEWELGLQNVCGLRHFQYWIEVSKWTAFVLGNKFLVFDLEKRLDENCI